MIDLHYYNSSISYSDRFDHAPTTTQELLSIHALERLELALPGLIPSSSLQYNSVYNRILIASLFTLHYLARIPLPLYSGV